MHGDSVSFYLSLGIEGGQPGSRRNNGFGEGKFGGVRTVSHLLLCPVEARSDEVVVLTAEEFFVICYLVFCDRDGLG